MKVVLILAALVAVAVAEQCKNAFDCTQHGITTCGSGFNVACNNDQCICTNGPTGQMCVSQSDCHDSCHKHGAEAHCVDGMCHCRRN